MNSSIGCIILALLMFLFEGDFHTTHNLLNAKILWRLIKDRAYATKFTSMDNLKAEITEEISIIDAYKDLLKKSMFIGNKSDTGMCRS